MDEIVLPCRDLDVALAALTEHLGFRLEMITPADAPAVAVVSGHGLRIRLDTAATTGRLQPAAELDALTEADLPPLDDRAAVVGPAAEAPAGRAGMRYRDLLPHRHGGRFIASHIAIPDGGPVPDYVHHHRIRFQVIYCCAGWVRVVYEDQGPPFVLRAGDCVLQPPGIRHRVLESSPGAEVVEVSSPAEHETFVDHELTLPTATGDPARTWAGQRFVRHVAAGAPWGPSAVAGFEARDTGVGDASAGLVGVRVLRPDGRDATAPDAVRHDGELRCWFVLAGTADVELDGHRETVGPGTAVTVPRSCAHRIAAASADAELLEISVPAALPTSAARPEAARLP